MSSINLNKVHHLLNKVKFYFHLSLGFLLTICFISCGLHHTGNDDSILDENRINPDLKKSEQSIAACKSIKIPLTIDLNASFINNFIKCSSNLGEGGEETLKGQISLLNQFGEKNLDKMIELLLYDPNNNSGPAITKNIGGAAHYPLLNLLVLFSEQNSDFTQLNSTFKDNKIDTFLKNSDPTLFFKMISLMEKDGTLKLFIHYFLNLVDEVEEAPFMALVFDLLEKRESRQSLVDFVDPIIQSDSIYYAFKELFTLNNSINLDQNQKNLVLADWCNPRIGVFSKDLKAENSSTPQYPSYPTNYDHQKVNQIESLKIDTNESNPLLHKTGLERHQELLKEISKEGLDSVSDFVTGMTKEFLTQTSDDRLTVLTRTHENFKLALSYQLWPIRNLLSTLTLVKDTPLDSLDTIVHDIFKVIEKNPQETLDPFSVKIGASKIHLYLENFILKGGKIPGCLPFAFPGVQVILNNLFEKNKEGEQVSSNKERQGLDKYYYFKNNFLLLLAPNKECEFNLSPLASLIISYLREELHCTKNREGETRSNNPVPSEDRFCPTELELTKLGENLIRTWNSSSNSSTPSDQRDYIKSIKEITEEISLEEVQKSDSQVLLKEFLSEIFDEIKRGILENGNYLRFKHLAKGSISLDDIEDIKNQVTSLNPINSFNLARLDEKLNIDPYYKLLFFPDLIENLIQEKIQSLNSTLEQFNGLLEFGSDEKLIQILSGLYNKGPYAKVVSKQFSKSRLPSETLWEDGLDDYRAEQFLSFFQREGAVFRNYRLDQTDPTESVLYPSIGDKNIAAEFSSTTDIKIPKNIYQLLVKHRDLFRFEASGGVPFRINGLFNIMDQFENMSDLLGKNVYDLVTKDSLERSKSSDDFIIWSKEKLFNYFAKSSVHQKWEKIVSKEIKSIDPLSTRFFVTTPYTRDELTKLLLFFSKQYLVVPGHMPSTADAIISGDQSSRTPNLSLPQPLPLENLEGGQSAYNKFLTLQSPPNISKPWTIFLYNFPSLGVFDSLNGDNSTISTLDSIDQSNFQKLFDETLWVTDYHSKYAIDYFSAFENGGGALLPPSLILDGDIESIKELMKLMVTLNLITYYDIEDGIYRSSQKRYLPLVGMAGNNNEGPCWNNLHKKTVCPITFYPNKLGELKKYIRDISTIYFCPYLTTDFGLSPNFIKSVTEKMALKLPPESMTLCRDKSKNLIHPETLKKKTNLNPLFKPEVAEFIISDFIQMGRSSKLAPVLKDLSDQIHFEKQMKTYLKDEERVFLGKNLINSPTFEYPLILSAYKQKKLSDLKGLTLSPGFLNSYLHLLKMELKGKLNDEQFMQRNLINNALKKIGEKSKESKTQGEVFYFLKDIIVHVYDQNKGHNLNVVDFTFKLAEELRNYPEYVTMLSNLLSYLDDLETAPLFNASLAQVLYLLKTPESGETRSFSWSDPDKLIFKQFLREENLLSAIALSKNFSSEDLLRAIRSLLQSLPVETSLLSKTVSQMITSSEDLFLSFSKKDDVYRNQLSILENHLLRFVTEPLPKNYYIALNAILEEIKIPHRKRGGQYLYGDKKNSNNFYPSILNEVAPLTRYFVRNLPEILSTFEEHENSIHNQIEYSKIGQGKTLTRELVTSFLNPIKKDLNLNNQTEESGIENLISLFDSPLIEDWNKTYLPIIQSSENIDLLLNSIRTLSMPSHLQYKNAIDEFSLLFPELNHFLVFINGRAEFSQSFSPDLQRGLKCMEHLSSDQNPLFKGHIDLLLHWLLLGEDRNNHLTTSRL